MKKLPLFGLLAATSLLTSCFIVAEVPSNQFGLRFLEYKSDKTLTKSMGTTPDIGTLPVGTKLICQNYPTKITATVQWKSGLGLKYYKVDIIDAKSGAVQSYGYYKTDFSGLNSTGKDSFSYNFSPKASELSLNGQTIVVKPIEKKLDVKGQVYLRVTAYDNDNNTVTIKSNKLVVTKCAVQN